MDKIENQDKPPSVEMVGQKNTFLFGDESPSVGGFFRTLTFRLALFYPVCIVSSNSLTDAWDLLLIFFWLLGGQWKERYRILKGSPILILSVLLTLISFVGVFQYETTLFQSLKYWRGHHPIPILIILSTLFTTKTRRIQILGTLGLSLFVSIVYSIAVLQGAMPECLGFLKRAHIAKNTIWFGMAITILAGLWICFPYVSRQNPLIRLYLGKRLRRSMQIAASVSLLQLLKTLFSLRYSFTTYALAFFRWGIVLSSLSYITLFNPSRTAILAILFGMSAILILWNCRGKYLFIGLLVVSTLTIAYGYSPTFQRKISSTCKELTKFQETWLEDELSHSQFVGGRLFLYWNLKESMLWHPLGIGMEKTRAECLRFTNGKIDNVHNEFIAIGVQSGVLALAIFLLWFFFLFRQSLRLPRNWRYLGIYVSVTLFIACMFNGSLSQDMEGHLYCILIALMASVDSEMRRKTRSNKEPDA